MRVQRVNFEAKYGIAALVSMVRNFLRDQLFSLGVAEFYNDRTKEGFGHQTFNFLILKIKKLKDFSCEPAIRTSPSNAGLTGWILVSELKPTCLSVW